MLKPSDRTRSNARKGRRDPTLPEAVFWKLLRDRRLDGLKFRRQLPLGPYIADFACPSIRLILELDGGVLQNPALLFQAVRDHAVRRPQA